jgi:hypothetical protein
VNGYCKVEITVDGEGCAEIIEIEQDFDLQQALQCIFQNDVTTDELFGESRLKF